MSNAFHQNTVLGKFSTLLKDCVILGISRSFTRKLHEWEKSRGIAPEASTSALLQAARAQKKMPQAPLTRTQSDGSVAPSAAGSGRHHASSLSVNDVDDFESEYEREHSVSFRDEIYFLWMTYPEYL